MIRKTIVKNPTLRKLSRKELKQAKIPVLTLTTNAKEEVQGFEKFSLYFRRGLNIVFTVLEALVIFSIFVVALKYCYFTIVNDADYKKIYDLIKFLKENYVGAIFLFLLIFSRTCLNMLYNIKVFRAKDFEVQLNEKDRMWDIK